VAWWIVGVHDVNAPNVGVTRSRRAFTVVSAPDGAVPSSVSIAMTASLTLPVSAE
jgi:hypothetical protein